MCLNPITIRNPRYIVSKKKGYKLPDKPLDERLRFIEVPCGHCIECLKTKRKDWIIRLCEELKTTKGLFITLTFDEENRCDTVEEVAVKIRLFLERWRKQFKKYPRYFMITERGANGTERLHVHGIWFTFTTRDLLEKMWSYGMVDIGVFCGERTAGYITKYMLKSQEECKIFASKGLGKTAFKLHNNFRGVDTITEYRTENGSKYKLPNYITQKYYSDEQREIIAVRNLNKSTIFAAGQSKLKETVEKDQKWAKECRENAIETLTRYQLTDDSWIEKKRIRKIKNYTKFMRKARGKSANDK